MISTAQRRFAPMVIGIDRNRDRHQIGISDRHRWNTQMLGPMMQPLLEDRFKMKVHRESKEVPVYELTVTKGGPKLQASTETGCVAFDADKELSLPQGKHFCGVLIRSVNPSVPTALYGATMADLCRGLTRLVGREVVDKTGIAGAFDIRLELSRADLFPLARMVPSHGDAPASATDPSGSSIFSAMQKLGLKLELGKGRAVSSLSITSRGHRRTELSRAAWVGPIEWSRDSQATRRMESRDGGSWCCHRGYAAMLP